MTNNQIKQFALNLLRADDEQQVIKVLSDAGYWDNRDAWRNYGDIEGNFSTIGNQQSRPEAALVEKVVNAVDARLLNACLECGIDPASAAAPTYIRDAVANFFDGTGGALRDWAPATRRREAEHITLATTGPKRHPCLTIADRGEGQMPASVPDTFMSLNKSNKLRIPFVQGKFNMGGTGVLKFCGDHRFQLLITKRNPAILTTEDKRDPNASAWSITITRRQRPTQGAGQVRNSVFTYLAPVGADANPEHGDVLTFCADTLPLMPQHNQPYVREVPFGSAIKLYDYDMKGFASHILMKDGLLYRLEALLPEIALPLNLHECRDYGGKTEASFVTPLAGLITRLEDGKGGNVEDGFPDSVPFHIRGERMVAKIYAFKEGRAATYTTNEGVIFSINGQTHGTLPKSLFGRKKVKLNRLTDSLLVSVDCTCLSTDAREDLFMNSRDRLSQHELRKDIESEIEDILARHEGLKELANQRRRNEIGERLAHSKPLEDVLGSLLKSSPTLAKLFRMGERLGNPFKRGSGGNELGKDGKGRGGQGGDGSDGEEFVGKPHPTYFRFRKTHSDRLERECEYGRRCRIELETDVENEYFKRTDNPGMYDVEVVDSQDGKYHGLELQNSLLLHNGLARWSVVIPEDIEIGETLTLQLTVDDETLADPFVNIAHLKIGPKNSRAGGKGRARKSDRTGGGGQQHPGIEMPEVREVYEKDWLLEKFDERSALKVMPESDGSYTFYVNMDNVYLWNELKYGKEDASLTKAKFTYGNVLVGLALLQDDKQSGKSDMEGEGDGGDTIASEKGHVSVEQRVLHTTRAIAPFMIPMINYLGALSEDDIATAATTGDEE